MSSGVHNDGFYPKNEQPQSSTTSDHQSQAPQSNKQQSKRKSGCFVCQRSDRIYISNKKNIPLERGDHIEIPLDNCCLGFCFNHHAIVDSFKLKNNGDLPPDEYGNINVFDVTVEQTKGENATANREQSTEANATANREQSTAANATANREQSTEANAKAKTQGYINIGCRPLKYKGSKDIHLKNVRLITYRKRRYSQMETHARAKTLHEQYENEILKSQYYVCTRNCEHFASTCANGNENLTEKTVEKVLRNSTCLQSARVCWIIVHVLSILAMAGSYVINVLVYIAFVGEVEHLQDAFNCLKFCFRGRKTCVWYTACNWYVFIGFGALLLLHSIGVCIYQCCKKEYVCSQCRLTAAILLFSKLLCFAGFETRNIFFERGWYSVYQCMGETLFIVFLLLVVVLEALLVYFVLAEWIAKIIVWSIAHCCCCKCCIGCCCICCLKCCVDEQSHNDSVRLMYA